MAKKWFTGDKHHGHVNVIKYDKRPFKDINHMNKILIRHHNEMVKEDDICYDLGDFYFRGGKEAEKKHYWDFLQQYQGRYVIIRGNHEKHNKIVDSIQTATMHISGLKIFCVHDPMHSRVEFDLNLVAHVHNAWKYTELKEGRKKSLLINVGVTQWNYRPVEWQTLYSVYMKWKKKQLKVEKFDKEALKAIRKKRKRK